MKLKSIDDCLELVDGGMSVPEVRVLFEDKVGTSVSINELFAGHDNLNFSAKIKVVISVVDISGFEPGYGMLILWDRRTLETRLVQVNRLYQG